MPDKSVMDYKRYRYICIDLKSFYASVECVERGLDPMSTPLVVADPERKDGTICLAVSPALKKLGIKNRCRVYEIPTSIDYIMAEPRMQKYIDYAADIYEIYLRYISSDDIHVYSVDEVFIDVTPYMGIYDGTGMEMAKKLMDEVRMETGIFATAGVGTNLYLTKVALDIIAKHKKDRIGYLDEEIYKSRLWSHKPITDFWRIGAATARTLERMGMLTMEDIAHASEDVLYNKFGIDAELLIDHAWGRESTTMNDIKSYHPIERSLNKGQVLMRDYTFTEALIIVKEMLEQLCIELTNKGLSAGSVTLYIGYSHSKNMAPSRGTAAFLADTDIYNIMAPEVIRVYERITDRYMPIRRINLSCNHVKKKEGQLTLYDMEGVDDAREIQRGKMIQAAVSDIRGRFGKNALLRAMDLQECATTPERNRQIGGHKSGE